MEKTGTWYGLLIAAVFWTGGVAAAGVIPTEAVAIQDEGTTGLDTLSAVTVLDGIYSPADVAPTGTVTTDYYANGTDVRYFDALELKFPSLSGPPGSLALRVFLQKGTYPTVEWEHYKLLPGLGNIYDGTIDPRFAPDVPDHYPAGDLSPDEVVGWVVLPFDPAWTAASYTAPDGSIVVTLNLWNWRVDAVELVPEPMTLSLVGIAGLGVLLRRPSRR